MSSHDLLKYSDFILLGLLVANLVALQSRGLLRTFWPISLFCTLATVDRLISIPLLFYRASAGLSKQMAYSIYFYTEWSLTPVGLLVIILTLSMLYVRAFDCVPGLKRLAKIVFRFVLFVVAVGVVWIATDSYGSSELVVLFNALRTLDTCVGLLMLCLLMFMSASFKQLNLSYRSRVFGLALGMGVFAVTNLVEATNATVGASVYSMMYVYSNLGMLTGLSVWLTYLILPESDTANEVVLLPVCSAVRDIHPHYVFHPNLTRVTSSQA